MSSEKPDLLKDATKSLAEFSSSLRFDHLPAAVVERLKLSFLDSLGCCVHGATLPWTRKIQAMILKEGAQEIATVLGTSRKSSIANAVLANSTAGHAFELDDIHKESIVHPGSLATPVAMAFAEPEPRFSGKDIIAAMAAGYEVGTRVGSAATMSLFFRGFHPQGTSGAFVAAATAARALNLSALQTQHAFGLVGSQAGGLMAAQEGAMVKRFHSGRAAQSGVYSAQLAADGFTGITNVLEAGYGGYLSSYSDAPNPRRLTDGLGTLWETLHIGYKPHATVTSIHTALDGLAAIMREHNVRAADIEKIDTRVSSMTHVHCAWPYQAQGVTAAQMNLYFGLAVMALDGAAFVAQYRAERLSDPEILSMIQRIRALPDPEIDAMGPAFRHASVVIVHGKDGRTFEKRTLHRHGSPEDPLTEGDIVYKFRNITDGILSRASVEALVKSALSLEKQQTMGPVIDLLQG